MSSNIWTRDALSSNFVSLDTTAWRVVEAQHVVSTMKLVDTLEEQELLEAVLEETKPPMPPMPEGIHYLLSAPFRYSRRNAFPSRFRRSYSETGVFYAAASPEAAIAEIVFYRRLFFAESPTTPIPLNPAEYTAFAVQLQTDKAIDLTRPPLSEDAKSWTDPEDYSACQILADEARAAGIEVIAYTSVRDSLRRLNFAVFSPVAFAQLSPSSQQTWRIWLRSDGSATAKCDSPKLGLSFESNAFDIVSRLRAGEAHNSMPGG